MHKIRICFVLSRDVNGLLSKPLSLYFDRNISNKIQFWIYKQNKINYKGIADANQANVKSKSGFFRGCVKRCFICSVYFSRRHFESDFNFQIKRKSEIWIKFNIKSNSFDNFLNFEHFWKSLRKTPTMLNLCRFVTHVAHNGI